MQRAIATCFVTAAAIAATAPVHAGSLTQVNLLPQALYNNLSKDVGAALAYRPMGPVDALGITGFDVGVDMGVTKLAAPAAFQTATGTSDVSLPMARLYAQKGLPFNIDIGFNQASAPGSNVKLTGYELRYAILPGSVVMPAVALRYSRSTLSGVSQVDLGTSGFDISVSKGFTIFKPYAGIGRISVDSTPMGTAAAAGLVKYSTSMSRSFFGLQISLGLPVLGVEVDKIGSTSTTSLKLGLRW